MHGPHGQQRSAPSRPLPRGSLCNRRTSHYISYVQGYPRFLNITLETRYSTLNGWTIPSFVWLYTRPSASSTTSHTSR